MPTYNYECKKCGIVEVVQKMSDKKLTKCPKCKGKVKRLISICNFNLKGSNWPSKDIRRERRTIKRQRG